jgi:hypothetical protein
LSKVAKLQHTSAYAAYVSIRGFCLRVLTYAGEWLWPLRKR